MLIDVLPGSDLWPGCCGLCLAVTLLVSLPGGPNARVARLARPPEAWGDCARPESAQTSPSPSADDVVSLADQVAALARAGMPPQRIWPVLADRSASAPIRAWARRVTAAQLRGMSAAQTLASAPEGSGLRLLAVALHVSERTGAALAETLDGFAAGLRAEREASQERATALAGPRATTWILSLLPLAGLALGGLVGGHPWTTLVGTSLGRACLLAGSVLWAAGRGWAAILVRRAQSA